MIAIDSSTAILIGGSIEGDGYSDQLWFFDFPSLKWTQAWATPKTARSQFACGLVYDSSSSDANSQIYIVAAGGKTGRNPNTFTDTTELLILEAGNSLTYLKYQIASVLRSSGPNLPNILHGMASVTSSDRKVLFAAGGRVGFIGDIISYSILEFKCLNHECSWSVWSQKLQNNRVRAVAVILPNMRFNCTQAPPEGESCAFSFRQAVTAPFSIRCIKYHGCIHVFTLKF